MTDTLPVWLDANPHAVISMAIFDMDVYLSKLALNDFAETYQALSLCLMN